MTTEAPIAVRKLRATWRDGSTHDVSIEIGRPYPSGNSYRWRIRASGLQQDYSPPDMSGSDGIHALMSSLSFVRFLFEWHLAEGGKLFYHGTDEPYIPDDLPKNHDDAAA